MTDTTLIEGATQFGAALAADLRDTRELAIAVAFAKQSALTAVDIENWCGPGHSVRLLAGLDYALTELELLRRLELTGHASCRVYHSIGGSIFHPKFYLLDKGTSVVVYIGSSNLTRGGLRENVEANVRLAVPRTAPTAVEARTIFDSMFQGEFATPLTPELESGYRELQAALQEARLHGAGSEEALRFRFSDALLLARYRARVAVGRWLLVTSPVNFEICIRTGIWGRQQEAEVNRYAAGDVFFFHVTDISRVVVFGMFTGSPFRDDSPLWPPTRSGGIFPWRIRFRPLAQLSVGVSTREVLETLRHGAPRNWFHGYIQQSHALAQADFEALRQAFEDALRRQGGGMI